MLVSVEQAYFDSDCHWLLTNVEGQRRSVGEKQAYGYLIVSVAKSRKECNSVCAARRHLNEESDTKDSVRSQFIRQWAKMERAIALDMINVTVRCHDDIVVRGITIKRGLVIVIKQFSSIILEPP